MMLIRTTKYDNNEPYNFYEGYIYHYDRSIENFINCIEFKEVFYELENMLKIHYQYIVLYNKINENEYKMKIFNEIKNIKEDFIFVYLEDGYVKLYKI